MPLHLLLVAIGIITIAMRLGSTEVPVVQFVANAPGIGLVGQRFMIATPIANDGTGNASNVQITAATLGSATLISPATFPVALGTIGPNQSYIFQTDFDATGLVQGTAYPLTITGTYQLNGVTVSFTLNLQMGLPPASPGSGTTATGMAYAEDLSGAPFPDYTIPFLGDNDAFIPVPIGPFVVGNPTLQNVTVQASGGNQPRQGPQAVSIPTNEDLLTLMSNGVAGDPAEPSGGGGGGVVFLSFNWDAAYKADGDTSFTLQNPRTMFPHSVSTYKFRSDQQVQYSLAIGQFIWIQQLSQSGASSPGQYRLATATPADIKTYGKSSNPTKAWKSWIITNDTVGVATGTQFDMPSLSIGNTYLYASWDVACPAKPKGVCLGLEVVRISLSDIQAGKNPLPVEHVTDPGRSGGCPPDTTNLIACFAHASFLSQDTGDQVFWAGHNGNTQLRFFNWPAGNTYYWSDLGPIHGYRPNGKGGTDEHVPSKAPHPIYSENPGGGPASQDWLYRRPEDNIHGITRSGSNVYLAWNAAPHDAIPYPYIEVVTVDISDYSFQQQEIYSPSVALGLASLATNACTGEVGISVGYGGNGQYPNHAVGFLYDTTYYGTTIGSVTGSSYGDYLNIRQNHTASLNGAYFDAFGYALTNASTKKTGTLTKKQVNVDIHHVIFGRPGACG